MKAIPPFIENSPDDMHCVNAVFRMVLLHFGKNDMSWEEIDAKSKAIPGRGTWTVCGDIELVRQGIQVANIEPVDYVALHRDGVNYLTRVFGTETASYYLAKSNIAAVLGDIPEFLRLVRHENRSVTTAEIISTLTGKAHTLIGATINSGILNNKKKFALHYVLLYDFDGTYLHLHDPGLPAVRSRKVTVAEFESCFMYPGGNGGIEVFSI